MPHALRLIIIGFVSILPVLIFGFPFFSHDGTPHAMWYSNFSEQLWAGELYPRWLTEMNGGLGSPVMFYYPPTGYYLTSPFRVFFTNDSQGWYQLGWSAGVAQIASGLCAFLWLKKISTRRAAFIAAALYMLMPYHLAFDLYRRGAFAEFWTFVWMPLVLYFVHGIACGRNITRAAFGLATSYALLVMTHLPVTLMFSFIPLVYAFHLAVDKRRARTLLATIAAMSLGVGLSAVYLLPALTMQGYVQMQIMTKGSGYFGNWFLITKLKPWGFTSGYFWMVFNMTALAACAYRVSRASLDEAAKREAMFWMVVAFACLFLMTPLSYPVWYLVTPLQKIQFPWRFMTVMCVALAALLALGITALERRFYLPGKKMRAFVSLLLALWIPYAVVQAWRAYPATRLNPAIVREDTDGINRRLGLNRDAPEYRTRWVYLPDDGVPPTRHLRNEKLRRLLERLGLSENGVMKANITDGAGGVSVEEWKPREIRLRVETPDGARLTVSQYYFPGWSARLSGDGEALTLEPSGTDGLINVLVPRGVHRVSLTLERNPAERYGGVISLASAIVLLLLCGLSFVKRKARGFIIA